MIRIVQADPIMTQGGESKVKARLIASGVAALAVASVGVPMALSGSASATPKAAPTLTNCAPKPAILGQSITLTGSGLTHAKVTVGTKHISTLTTDTKAKIVFTVPTKGVSTKKAGTAVKVKTANGKASLKCTFAKPAARSKK